MLGAPLMTIYENIIFRVYRNIPFTFVMIKEISFLEFVAFTSIRSGVGFSEFICDKMS